MWLYPLPGRYGNKINFWDRNTEGMEGGENHGQLGEPMAWQLKTDHIPHVPKSQLLQTLNLWLMNRIHEPYLAENQQDPSAENYQDIAVISCGGRTANSCFYTPILQKIISHLEALADFRCNIHDCFVVLANNRSVCLSVSSMGIMFLHHTYLCIRPFDMSPCVCWTSTYKGFIWMH